MANGHRDACLRCYGACQAGSMAHCTPTGKAADALATFAWVTHRTHQLIGVSAALAGAKLARADPVQSAGIAAAAFYGSWLPDADQLGSRVHRRSRLERRNLVLGALGMLLRVPLLVFGAVSTHRGTAHSLLACALTAAIVGAVVWLFDPLAGAIAGCGVALGYGAHLAADACTPGGVPALAPFSCRRTWLLPAALRVRTGGFGELTFAAVAASMVGALLFSSLS